MILGHPIPSLIPCWRHLTDRAYDTAFSGGTVKIGERRTRAFSKQKSKFITRWLKLCPFHERAVILSYRLVLVKTITVRTLIPVIRYRTITPSASPRWVCFHRLTKVRIPVRDLTHLDASDYAMLGENWSPSVTLTSEPAG